MTQDQVAFAGSILVLGIMLTIWLLRKAKLRRARNWPIVAGRVDSTAVTLKTGGGQPGSASYAAVVKYSYVVQGQAYPGVLRRSFMLKGTAEKWVARYANSDPLTVRYDPVKARDSVVLESDHPASAPRSVHLCLLIVFAPLLVVAPHNPFAQTPANHVDAITSAVWFSK